jgi:defect-in-organelle-trafficking protein DotC
MKSVLFIITILFAYNVSASATNVVNKTPEEYKKYLAQGIMIENKVIDVEINEDDEEIVTLMLAEAMSLGTQGGSYWASQQISQYLSDHSHILDKINFKPLVIEYPQYYVLPVVVTEDDGRSRISEKGKVMRILGKSFFIESEPKLLVSIPSWRDYLYVDAMPPNAPHEAYQKYIDKYPTIWVNGIKQGWNVGLEQAVYTIETRISRLTRDYIGLVRYHLIKDQNIISGPIIKEVYRPVSGGGNELSIEDTIVEIEISPQLNTNRFNWNMVPQLPDVSHLFPDNMQSGFISDLRKGKVLL